MKNRRQIETFIADMTDVIADMKQYRFADSAIANVRIVTETINTMLYHTSKLKFEQSYNLETEEGYFAYIGEVEALIELWKQSLDRRTGTETDVTFWEYYEYFKYVSPEQVYQAAVEALLALPEQMKLRLAAMDYAFLNAKLNTETKDYSLIEQHVRMMTEKVEQYRWLYEKLADYRSKKILNGIIHYWFTFDIMHLQTLGETLFADYWDLDILSCSNKEVIADLGAWVGDSALEYLHTFGSCSKIYSYEITQDTYDQLCANTADFPAIIPIRKGISSQKGTMYVNRRADLGNKIEKTGEDEIEVTTLDEDLNETLTLIKMDIEGEEKEALKGAVQHIQADRPKLLVSAYHLPGDLFDIPLMIDSIRNDYKFYLRYHAHNTTWPCDYVIYAV